MKKFKRSLQNRFQTLSEEHVKLLALLVSKKILTIQDLKRADEKFILAKLGTPTEEWDQVFHEMIHLLRSTVCKEK